MKQLRWVVIENLHTFKKIIMFDCLHYYDTCWCCCSLSIATLSLPLFLYLYPPPSLSLSLTPPFSFSFSLYHSLSPSLPVFLSFSISLPPLPLFLSLPSVLFLFLPHNAPPPKILFLPVLYFLTRDFCKSYEIISSTSFIPSSVQTAYFNTIMFF